MATSMAGMCTEALLISICAVHCLSNMILEGYSRDVTHHTPKKKRGFFFKKGAGEPIYL